MYVKTGAATQEEIKLDLSLKAQVEKRGTEALVNVVNVGDQVKCPECEATGRVVWVSEDKKTMGVRCPASHRGLTHESKYGASSVTVAKARKNVVFLTPAEK